MKSKLLAAATLAIGLAATPFAFAQNSDTGSADIAPKDPGTTSSIDSSGGEDAAGSLSGPNIREFFTDNGMSTLRPANEIGTVYGRMSVDEQTNLRAACASNQDPRYDELCASVGAM
jgi:hypothetical protein